MCFIFIVIKFDTSAMHRGTAADKPETWPAVSCRAHPNYMVFLLVCSCSFRHRICPSSGQLCFQKTPLPRTTFVRFLQGGLSVISFNTLVLGPLLRFLFLALCLTSLLHSSSLNILLACILQSPRGCVLTKIISMNRMNTYWWKSSVADIEYVSKMTDYAVDKKK